MGIIIDERDGDHDLARKRVTGNLGAMCVLAACLGWGHTIGVRENRAAPLPARADSTFLVLLGTGFPRPNPDASGPATAVVVGERVFLFDAGTGIERQLAAAQLPINGVTAAFITHLHSDHTLGLPDLILTSWVMGRRAPMHLYGPSGLRAMVDHILAAWHEDIEIRITGLEHEPREGYGVTTAEIRPGVVYDSAGVRITAIPVNHGDWKDAFGYRIDTPSRSFVISGDTRSTPSIQAAARNVDVLVHEVYSADHLKPEPRPGGEDWPRYMQAFHASDVEVGQLAASAQPRVLVLTHTIRMGATDADLIAGIRQGGFRGTVIVGTDLARY